MMIQLDRGRPNPASLLDPGHAPLLDCDAGESASLG
jgi:hypothetical protein